MTAPGRSRVPSFGYKLSVYHGKDQKGACFFLLRPDALCRYVHRTLHHGFQSGGNHDKRASVRPNRVAGFKSRFPWSCRAAGVWEACPSDVSPLSIPPFRGTDPRCTWNGTRIPLPRSKDLAWIPQVSLAAFEAKGRPPGGRRIDHQYREPSRPPGPHPGT